MQFQNQQEIKPTIVFISYFGPMRIILTPKIIIEAKSLPSKYI